MMVIPPIPVVPFFQQSPDRGRRYRVVHGKTVELRSSRILVVEEEIAPSAGIATKAARNYMGPVGAPAFSYHGRVSEAGYAGEYRDCSGRVVVENVDIVPREVRCYSDNVTTSVELGHESHDHQQYRTEKSMASFELREQLPVKVFHWFLR